MREDAPQNVTVKNGGTALTKKPPCRKYFACFKTNILKYSLCCSYITGIRNCCEGVVYFIGWLEGYLILQLVPVRGR